MPRSLGQLRNRRFGNVTVVDRTGRASDGRRNPFAELECIWVVHDAAPDWQLGVTFSADGRVVGYTFAAPIDDDGDWTGEEAPRRLPPGGVTARAVRRVPWLEVEQAARQALRLARTSDVVVSSATWVAPGADGSEVHVPHVEGGGMDGELFKRALDRLGAVDDAPTRAKPGPVPRDDRFFAELARDYVAVLDEHPKSPIKHLAERCNYSVSTVRGMIAECRPDRRGLLTAVSRGRAGGELTPYARSLLGMDGS